MAQRSIQRVQALGLFQGFCLLATLVPAPSSSFAQATTPSEPLIATDVSGAAITPPKSGNIFDASPRVQMQKPIIAPSAQTRAASSRALDKVEAGNQGTPGTLPPAPKGEAEDIPQVRAISRDAIAERAGQDSALMRAVEQSRKLQQRLGVVSGPTGDPKNTLNNLKENIDKQEQLEEKEKYRF